MRVKECMCSNVIKVDSEEKLTQVARLMKENDIGSIPVCNEQNKVIGFITDRDIVIKCVANNQNCNNTQAADIMCKDVIKTTPDTDVEFASRVMEENQIRRLPVIEDDRIVGILSIGDLARNEEVLTEDVGYTIECICEEDK